MVNPKYLHQGLAMILQCFYYNLITDWQHTINRPSPFQKNFDIGLAKDVHKNSSLADLVHKTPVWHMTVLKFNIFYCQYSVFHRSWLELETARPE